MTAYDRILALVHGVRDLGDGRAVFRCPAHDDKNPSVSATQFEGGVAIHCFAGCSAEDIVSALRLKLSDLFDNPRTDFQLDPAAQKQARARRGLEDWRLRQLDAVCHLLRFLDDLVDEATGLLKAFGRIHTGTPAERDAAWDTLAFAYHQITELEHDCERLNSKSRASHLEVWRQYQEVLDAAS